MEKPYPERVLGKVSGSPLSPFGPCSLSAALAIFSALSAFPAVFASETSLKAEVGDVPGGEKQLAALSRWNPAQLLVLPKDGELRLEGVVER